MTPPFLSRLAAGTIRPYLVLTALCLALFLPGLAAVPPLDRDESRFMQATKQMLETGDYVRINFQDESRAKKPVGVYWLQAASVSLLAEGRTAAWAYRLPSLLAAWAAALLTFAFGQSLFGRSAALLGAGLTAASLTLVLEAHQAKTDAVLLACVVAAQGALARFYLQGHGGKPPGVGVALVFWIAQGVGILVKGPIVPMVSLLTMAALAVADRRLAWLHGLRPVTGLLVAAAIVAPWAAAISEATGGAFIGDAVRSDLLPKLIGGQESHGAWPGYYLLLATLTLWPGSLFLWPALAAAWRRRGEAPVRFILAWVAPAWVMFELIPTKLPHYVLPTYPALALLIGSAVVGGHAALGARAARWYYVAWAGVGLLLAGAAVAAPAMLGDGLSMWSLPAATAALAAGALPAWLAWRGRPAVATGAAVAGAVLAYAAIFHGVLPALERMWVAPRVVTVVDAALPGAPAAAAGYHEPSLVFLLGTRTRLTDGAGVADWMAEQPRAIAIVEERQHDAFRRRAEALGLAPTGLAIIEGFNYSRGRDITLRIYGKED